MNKPLFTHEFGHNLYNAPHTFQANGVVGQHFNTTDGFGMVGGPMLDCANAWERWYLKWIELMASGDSGDINQPSDLPASGLLTLRDCISTGDAVRIRLPNSRQPDGSYHYLWLENHQGVSVWDDQWWHFDGQSPPVAFPPPPRGLMAYVEDMHMGRTTPEVSIWNSLDLGAGGLRLLPATGNFDATPTGASSLFGLHYFVPQNVVYDFKRGADNPTTTGGNYQTARRADRYAPTGIDYDPSSNSSNNEAYYFWSLEGRLIDPMIASDAAYNRVGQHLGMGYNPAIFPSPTFDYGTQALSPAELSGLSVEVVNVDPNGDITVRVRFDEVDLVQRTRWTGNVALSPPVSGTGYSANVAAGTVLVIDKTGTPNRSQPLTPGSSSYYEYMNNSRLTVHNGASLHLDDYGKIILRANSTLYVDDIGSLTADPIGSIQVERGSKVSVKTQAEADALRVSGQLWLLRGGMLEIRDTGTIITGRASAPPVVQVYPNPGSVLRFSVVDAGAPATYRYRVFNSQGRVLQINEASAAALAEGATVNGLQPGPYLLEVQKTDGTNRVVERFEIR